MTKQEYHKAYYAANKDKINARRKNKYKKKVKVNTVRLIDVENNVVVGEYTSLNALAIDSGLNYLCLKIAMLEGRATRSGYRVEVIK